MYTTQVRFVSDVEKTKGIAIARFGSSKPVSHTMNTNLDEKQKRLLQAVLQNSSHKGDLSLMAQQVNNKKVTPVKEATKKKESGATEHHFSGSAFLNSPDASQLPMPNFDDDSAALPAVSGSSLEKTEYLRRYLKIRPQETK